MIRRPLLAAAVTAVSLAVLWGTTNIAGDRTVLVSPPHGRAASVVHFLAAHRADLALRELSPELRRQVTAMALQESFDAIDRELGGVQEVHGETIFYDEDRAAARVELIGRGRVTLALDFQFAWVRGKWIVQELPPRLSNAVGYTR
jgi:hypothetical protein